MAKPQDYDWLFWSAWANNGERFSSQSVFWVDGDCIAVVMNILLSVQATARISDKR